MAELLYLRQSKIFVSVPEREEERQEGAENRQGDGKRLGSYMRWRASVKPLVTGSLQGCLRTGWLCLQLFTLL